MNASRQSLVQPPLPQSQTGRVTQDQRLPFKKVFGFLKRLKSNMPLQGRLSALNTTLRKISILLALGKTKMTMHFNFNKVLQNRL